MGEITGAARRSKFREKSIDWAQPTLFGLEYSDDWLDSLPERATSREFFDEVSLPLPEAGTPRPQP